MADKTTTSLSITDPIKLADLGDGSYAVGVALKGSFVEVEEYLHTNALSVPANSWTTQVAYTFTKPVKQAWILVQCDKYFTVGAMLKSPGGRLQDNHYTKAGQTPSGTGRWKWYLIMESTTSMVAVVPTPTIVPVVKNEDTTNTATVSIAIVGVNY